MAAHELDLITIAGFKSIRSIENLKIRPTNILIGANGSGKSNFLGAMEFLHSIQQGKLRQYAAQAGGAEKILHFGSKTTSEIRLEVLFGGGFGYRRILLPSADDSLYEFQGPWYKDFGAFSEAPGDEEIRQHLDQWRTYHLHDTSTSCRMRKTADLHDNHELRRDGGNLAAFLHLLKHRWPLEYQLIEQTVRLVAPFLGGFRLDPLELNPETIRLEWRHKDSDQYFDASSLSDGTLRFIALATLFLQPGKFRPSVILVDEPELGLHPYAIQVLASLIKQASAKSQVIVSTQSSLLLDYFEPEDVLVAERFEGSTEIRRLNRADLATWLEDYSLGQLWEKNEIGGRPTPE